MSTTEVSPRSALGLRPGDRVRVRSALEISQTLDAEGRLDGVPFMPEMLAYCGRTMVVSMRADKTCDGAGTVRWMDDAVHLAGARCDGSNHDGCQAACKLFWKEAWLDRETRPITAAPLPHPPDEDPVPPAVADRLLPLTTFIEDGQRHYRCQATEVVAATRPLPPWQLEQYRVDLQNWSLLKLLRNLAVTVFNRYQALSRSHLPARFRFRDGERYPFVTGQLTKTPRVELGLQPGDRVRVRSKEEILATLDKDNRNRGLMFDSEMLRYCGQVGTVRERITKIIDEHTGRMIEIDSDCVTLDGMVCKADYHRLCSRGIYQYWREIWLEKVGD